MVLFIFAIIHTNGYNHRLFTKYYYKFVYDFDYKYFESLDDTGKFEYYQLLLVMSDLVTPIKKKESILNQNMNRTLEIISYIEKKYPDIINIHDDE